MESRQSLHLRKLICCSSTCLGVVLNAADPETRSKAIEFFSHEYVQGLCDSPLGVHAALPGSRWTIFFQH